MSVRPAASGDGTGNFKPRKTAVIGVSLLVFVVILILALFLCQTRVEYERDRILNQQMDFQLSFIDKNNSAIRVWRNEIVNQASNISSSEMFRLFINDARDLSPSEMEWLSQPDALSDPNDATRALAEQLSYIQDLLKDFMARRSWTDARLLLPSGVVMIEPPFSQPLTGSQIAISRKASESGLTVFGPIRSTDEGYFIDMADPLFQVGAQGEKDNVVGVLLLSLPLDKPLATFLSRPGEYAETILPRIICQNGDALLAVFAQAGNLVQEPVNDDITKIASVPFKLRESINRKEMVYSLGTPLLDLNWLYVVETPAAIIDKVIEDQKYQIYGVGVLASLGAALLTAWLWAGYTSRRHKADAQRYEKLYRIISEQKLVLDSVYASFKAAIVLVDRHGRAQLFNPLFGQLFGKKDIEPTTPLIECLPAKDALKIMECAHYAQEADAEASMEITLPTYGLTEDGKPEDRLYRVTLYPYTDMEKDAPRFRGCVLIFNDITKFRREAMERAKQKELESQRQEGLIKTFVRAVESVDPHLSGHSAKMAGLAELLSKELLLNQKEAETLKMAAHLSQLGKIFIPREILLKQGALTPEEKEQIQRAMRHTDQALEGLQFDIPVAETVKMMGERADGTGKPRGLTKDQIPLTARALAVINAFIAMTSGRSYRNGEKMTRAKAIEILRRDPGFDEAVVLALENLSRQDIDKVLGPEETADETNGQA